MKSWSLFVLIFQTFIHAYVSLLLTENVVQSQAGVDRNWLFTVCCAPKQWSYKNIVLEEAENDTWFKPEMIKTILTINMTDQLWALAKVTSWKIFSFLFWFHNIKTQMKNTRTPRPQKHFCSFDKNANTRFRHISPEYYLDNSDYIFHFYSLMKKILRKITFNFAQYSSLLFKSLIEIQKQTSSYKRNQFSI